jgi:hypothetical protein
MISPHPALREADSPAAGEDRDWSRNMAEPEMAGQASQRSVQWVEGGATTIVVSGLLTISWRVYTAGKIPFWSAWPGILGVAVVGAGLIMLVVGAVLRDNEERPGPS